MITMDGVAINKLPKMCCPSMKSTFLEWMQRPKMWNSLHISVFMAFFLVYAWFEYFFKYWTLSRRMRLFLNAHTVAYFSRFIHRCDDEKRANRLQFARFLVHLFEKKHLHIRTYTWNNVTMHRTQSITAFHHSVCFVNKNKDYFGFAQFSVICTCETHYIHFRIELIAFKPSTIIHKYIFSARICSFCRLRTVECITSEKWMPNQMKFD